MEKFEAPILIVNHKFKYNNYFTVQIVLCLAIGLFNQDYGSGEKRIKQRSYHSK